MSDDTLDLLRRTREERDAALAAHEGHCIERTANGSSWPAPGHPGFAAMNRDWHRFDIADEAYRDLMVEHGPALLAEVARLRADLAAAQVVVASLAERVKAQSDLLGRRAEHGPALIAEVARLRAELADEKQRAGDFETMTSRLAHRVRSGSMEQLKITAGLACDLLRRKGTSSIAREGK